MFEEKVLKRKRQEFINNIRNESEKELLDLQNRYESGKLKEEDMSEEQKNKLIQIYQKQIGDLERDIEKNKKAMSEYKEKILKVRKKMNN